MSRKSDHSRKSCPFALAGGGGAAWLYFLSLLYHEAAPECSELMADSKAKKVDFRDEITPAGSRKVAAPTRGIGYTVDEGQIVATWEGHVVSRKEEQKGKPPSFGVVSGKAQLCRTQDEVGGDISSNGIWEFEVKRELLGGTIADCRDVEKSDPFIASLTLAWREAGAAWLCTF